MLDPHEIHKRALVELAAASVSQTLSVIFNCRTGELIENPSRSGYIESLIKQEVGPILRALHPLGQEIKGLSDEMLIKRITEVSKKRAMNFSQMWREVQAEQAEHYHDLVLRLNGWLVKKGQALGLSTTYNETMIRLVKERRILQDAEISTVFPLGTGLRSVKEFPSANSPWRAWALHNLGEGAGERR